MLYQVSYSNTGSLNAICAQDYVEADDYDTAYSMGCSRAIGREVVVAVNRIWENRQSWRRSSILA